MGGARVSGRRKRPNWELRLRPVPRFEVAPAAETLVYRLGEALWGALWAVHNVRERIAVDGEPIAATELVTLIRTQTPVIAAATEELCHPPSHFEVLTALAFAHFAARAVDVMVVETGLGGVRDATNVLSPESLACAVITTLDTVRSQLCFVSSSFLPLFLGRGYINEPGL